MKRQRFSIEQIVSVLKQAEMGMPVADLIRRIGITEQTYHRWKRQYAGLESDQVGELKQILEENNRLKKLVAELSQRLGGNAALNDPRGGRCLEDRALTRAAAIARAAGDQHAEGSRHDVETLCNGLTDLVERATAAGASLILDVDDLLDPLEVGRQRAAVGLVGAIPRCPACLVHGVLGLGQGRLDLLQGKLELIGIELLGPAAEPVPLQGLDDRLQAFNLGLENLQNIELSGLLEDERAERFDVVGKVRFHEHESGESGGRTPVNRQSAGRSGGVRHAPGASPDSRARRRMLRRQPHNTVLDTRPLEPAGLQPLGHQAHAGAIPPDELDPVTALRPEHVDHARIGITPILGADQRS